MEVELALALVKELLAPEYLSPPQEMVFKAAWAGQSYRDLAEAAGYDHDYLKGIGAQIWRMLSTATKQRVTKSNFRQILESLAATLAPPVTVDSAPSKSRIDWGEAVDVSVFYGRELECCQLYEWMVVDRCRLVAILGMGGIGKTTIAIKLLQELQANVQTTDSPLERLRQRGGAKEISPDALGAKVEAIATKEATPLPTDRQCQSQFSYILWRSLLNAPLLQELLPEIIRTLIASSAVNSHHKVVDSNAETFTETNFHTDLIPSTITGQLELLLEICQQYRCLIMLDNCESIFQGGAQVGQYRVGYADYGDLFSTLGRTNHQSCLLLTSREKPTEISQLEGVNARVRSLTLPGLQPAAGQQIFADRGCLPIAAAEWLEIDRYYGGNPLAFQLIAAAVKEVADGDVSEIFPYLRSNQLGFADIHILLQQQWERLTSAEQQVMYWLAIAREPMSIVDFEAALHPAWNRQLDGNEPISNNIGSATAIESSLLTVLQFLRRRSIIVTLPSQSEQGKRYWSLQPMVKEYVTGKFVEQICAEIDVQQPFLLNTQPILQANAKEYIRQAQIRTIVQPVIVRLGISIGNSHQIGAHLRQILTQWQNSKPLYSGYLTGNLLNLLIQLKLDLTDFDCSELVIQQAYLVGLDLKGVNFTNSHLVNCAFTQTFSTILAIDYSPDGNTFATSDSNGEIRLWRVHDNQCLLTCSGHTNWIRGLKFSPDGQYLVSASDDLTIKLWDLQDGNCLRTIGEGIHSFGCSFSPDGRYLASGSANNLIYYWDLHTGTCVKQFAGHQDWSLAVKFHPQGHQLVSGSSDGTVRLWDVASGNCVRIWHGHENWVTTVDYSPDGKTILSGSLDGTMRLWDVVDGKCQLVLTGHGDEIWSAVFSPDGRYFVSVGVGGLVRMWRTIDGHCLHRLEGHSNRLWSVAIHPDGHHFASGGEDRSIRFWQVSDGKCLQVLRGYSNCVKSIAWSPDSQRLITASRDAQVRVWDLHTQSCLYQLSGHPESTMAVAYDPQGLTFASGSEDGTIRIWDAQTLAYTKILRGHTNSINALAYSPNGKYLISGGDDRSIGIWDLQRGRRVQVLHGHNDRIRGLAYHPHGHLIASASEDSTVSIWNLQDNTPVRTLIQHPNRAIAVAFDPRGAILASGGIDRQILLWNIETGKRSHSLTGHEGWILSLTYSHDGKWLFSGASDHTIKVWSMETGICTDTLTDHQSWIWSVAVSKCGRFLASASEDEIIRIWDASNHHLLSIRRTSRPYDGMNIHGVEGLTKAQIDGLKALGAQD
jgi:WD40 repeat protein